MQDPRDGPNWLPFPLSDRSRPATVPPWVQLSRPGTGVDDQLVAAHWDHPPAVRSSRRLPCHRPVVEPTNWSQLSHRPFRPVPYHPHPQFSTKSTVPTGPTGPEAQTFSPPPVGKLINWSRCGRFDGRSWSSPPFSDPPCPVSPSIRGPTGRELPAVRQSPKNFSRAANGRARRRW